MRVKRKRRLATDTQTSASLCKIPLWIFSSKTREETSFLSMHVHQNLSQDMAWDLECLLKLHLGISYVSFLFNLQVQVLRGEMYYLKLNNLCITSTLLLLLGICKNLENTMWYPTGFPLPKLVLLVRSRLGPIAFFGLRTRPVPESFRIQERWTGTAKNCKNQSKPVVTGLRMNTIK